MLHRDQVTLICVLKGQGSFSGSFLGASVTVLQYKAPFICSDVTSILPFTSIAFIAVLTDSSKTLNLVATTAAEFLIYEYEKQKWRAVGARKERQKQIVFMISTLVENVFWGDKKWPFDLCMPLI